MKFKILKGTKTYDKIMELFVLGQKCRQAAIELTNEVGAKNYARSTMLCSVFGGISAFQFDAHPGHSWVKYDRNHSDLYKPRANKANEPLFDKIYALPVVTKEEFNAVVGFEGPQTVSAMDHMLWVDSVGMTEGIDCFLMEMDDGCTYAPPNSDIIEITVSEYKDRCAAAEKNEAATA